MTTIGFIGAGHIGSQVARLCIANGFDVVLSNSRGPDTLRELVTELGSQARAASVDDAARLGDIVVVTIPLRAYRSVPVEPLAGKIVIDTNNYYPQRDGHIAELDAETRDFDRATAKTFAALQGRQGLQPHLRPGHHDRRAAAQHAESQGARRRGDDPAAKATVRDVLDRLGFDSVDAGAAADSWRIQPGTPAYGPRRNAEQLRADLAAATHVPPP